MSTPPASTAPSSTAPTAARADARPAIPPALLVAIAAAAAAAFAIGVAIDSHPLRLATKPWPVVMLAIWLARSAERGAYRRFVVLGLAASLAGDLFLEIAPRELFVAGLASFLVAHVLYVVAYASDARGAALLRAVPAYAYGALVLIALWPGLASSAGGAMTIPVTLYTLVICTMLWRAAARVGVADPASARLALGGAIVFALSDTLIALGRFGEHLVGEDVRASTALRLTIMASYWLGQWGIAASAVRRAA